MARKILLVEDDRDLHSLLKYNLKKAGFTFSGTHTGRHALDQCRRVQPDLVLLDITLPDSDGFDICQLIRNDADLARTPIIFLTARASETARLIGLELGANDYVVKPFFIRELIARIRLQFPENGPLVPILKAGGLELDRMSCRVRLNGGTLELTATEFHLLEVLMTRPGVMLSRAQLVDAVWGKARPVSERSVDVYILRLRQKIENGDPTSHFIHAHRGFGYIFEIRAGASLRVQEVELPRREY